MRELSKRCLRCGSRGARGSWRLCLPCDPIPFWAVVPPFRWIPWVRFRWYGVPVDRRDRLSPRAF